MDTSPANTSSICGAQAGAGHLSSSQQFHEVGVHVSILTNEETKAQRGEFIPRSHC